MENTVVLRQAATLWRGATIDKLISGKLWSRYIRKIREIRENRELGQSLGCVTSGNYATLVLALVLSEVLFRRLLFPPFREHF